MYLAPYPPNLGSSNAPTSSAAPSASFHPHQQLQQSCTAVVYHPVYYPSHRTQITSYPSKPQQFHQPHHTQPPPHHTTAISQQHHPLPVLTVLYTATHPHHPQQEQQQQQQRLPTPLIHATHPLYPNPQLHPEHRYTLPSPPPPLMAPHQVNPYPRHQLHQGYQGHHPLSTHPLLHYPIQLPSSQPLPHYNQLQQTPHTPSPTPTSHPAHPAHPVHNNNPPFSQPASCDSQQSILPDTQSHHHRASQTSTQSHTTHSDRESQEPPHNHRSLQPKSKPTPVSTPTPNPHDQVVPAASQTLHTHDQYASTLSKAACGATNDLHGNVCHNVRNKDTATDPPQHAPQHPFVNHYMPYTNPQHHHPQLQHSLPFFAPHAAMPPHPHPLNSHHISPLDFGQHYPHPFAMPLAQQAVVPHLALPQLFHAALPADPALASRQSFYAAIKAFRDSIGAPIQRLPTLGFKELDLWVLYTEVTRRGGVDTVIAKKQWKEIAEVLQLPSSCTDSGFRLRVHYKKYLEAYERRFFTPPKPTHENKGSKVTQDKTAPHAGYSSIRANGKNEDVSMTKDDSDTSCDKGEIDADNVKKRKTSVIVQREVKTSSSQQDSQRSELSLSAGRDDAQSLTDEGKQPSSITKVVTNDDGSNSHRMDADPLEACDMKSLGSPSSTIEHPVQTAPRFPASPLSETRCTSRPNLHSAQKVSKPLISHVHLSEKSDRRTSRVPHTEPQLPLKEYSRGLVPKKRTRGALQMSPDTAIDPAFHNSDGEHEEMKMSAMMAEPAPTMLEVLSAAAAASASHIRDGSFPEKSRKRDVGPGPCYEGSDGTVVTTASVQSSDCDAAVASVGRSPERRHSPLLSSSSSSPSSPPSSLSPPSSHHAARMVDRNSVVDCSDGVEGPMVEADDEAELAPSLGSFVNLSVLGRKSLLRYTEAYGIDKTSNLEEPGDEVLAHRVSSHLTKHNVDSTIAVEEFIGAIRRR